MAEGLPALRYADGITKRKQVKFGGYHHAKNAANGELYDMTNLSGDLYPLLSTRPARQILRTLTKPNGIWGHDGIYTVDGTGFFAGTEKKGTVTDSRKRFADLGPYLIILPDKAYYNRTDGTFGMLEKSYTGACVIKDGTFAGQSAKANTITVSGSGGSGTTFDFATLFSAGDAVRISGATQHPENNRTAIIREVDGTSLHFYENIFTVGENGDGESTLTIKREVPELDFICSHENRLWGCKGDTIYASKLGDPFNWNVFDGLTTDSYAVDVQSAGDFTGCISAFGYPIFFKEDAIYKVYGSKPSNFQVLSSASLGVERGSDRSLAIAGETLFYLSRTGITAYGGGVPQSVATAFGQDRYKNAVGGSDGSKYYVSMQNAAGEWSLFVYDTRCNLWHREDATQAVGFAWDGELYTLSAQGRLFLCGNVRQVPQGATAETAVPYLAQWADFTEYTTSYSTATPAPEKKHITKLLLRAELDAGASCKIELQYDGDGIWHTAKTLTATKKRSFYLPIIPRRCDYFALRLSGSGGMILYSLVREIAQGSEND